MIVLDTGVLYAAADRRDDRHADCESFFDSHVDDDFVLPAPVVVETAWLIGARLGAHAEAVFLSTVGAGALRVHDLDGRDWTRVADLVRTYADLSLGVVDASVVVCAERVGATVIATLNHRDFLVVRPAHTDAFTLLP